MPYQLLLQFNTRFPGGVGSTELLFLNMVLIGEDAEISFSFKLSLETQPSFLTEQKAPADRKSFCVCTCTQQFASMGGHQQFSSSCNDFIFSGQQCYAAQVASNTLGSH